MDMYRPPFMARPPPPPPPPGPYYAYSSQPMARESSPSRQTKAYIPSSKAQLILNRLSMDQPRGYSPAPRLPPRLPPPPYYDYDIGYGSGYCGGYGGYGGYGYGGYPSYAPPPVPRYSGRRYDLDEDYDLSYMPRYRPLRYSDTLAEIEKEKLRKSPSPSVPSTYTSSSYMPGLEGEEEPPHIRTKTRESGPPPTEEVRHSSLSEPQMLQDQVDKMRMRLKNLAYSLDPTGPVPEIVVPERSRRTDSDIGRKYSSGMELAELPRTSRKQHYYPEDDHMKDNLRIKCLSHYKTTRTAAGYCKPKLYQPSEALSNTYSSKYPLKTTSTASKWEEPDTVYGSSTDRKPYSKPEEEEDDSKKERRKKKKSKERDEVPAAPAAPVEAPAAVTAAEAPSEGAGLASEVSEAVSAPSETPAEGGDELDEKEKKRLEKKKRKAEREAAAKAAMEAELAALAAAEAELARLEADAMKASEADAAPAAAPEPTAATEAAKEAKGSETAAEKCESPTTLASEGLSECPPTELEPEPSPQPQPALESAASEPVPETVESEVAEEKEHEEAAEAIPGSVVEQVSADPESAAPEPPTQEAPVEPAPAAEEAAPATPPAEEAYEEPQYKPKPRSQGEDAFDWSAIEAEGPGDGGEPQIGTQEPVQEEKVTQEGGEEVTTQEPVNTQPEEHLSQEPESEPEQPPTIAEEQADLHTDSEPQIEKEETVSQQPAEAPAVEQAAEETPAVQEQTLDETPAAEPPKETQTEETVEENPQDSSAVEQSEEPVAEFKPLDESDSFWGTED